MDGAVRDAGPAAAVRISRPFLGQVQLPVQRARGGVRRGVNTDRNLTVRPLPERPAVLAGDPGRGPAALGKRHIVDHPHLRSDHFSQSLGDPSPNRRRIPRRLAHELLQGLHVSVRQPLGHRLDRLTPPVQHQAPEVAHTPPALILPRQRPEHITHELRQLAAEPLDIPQFHISKMPTTRQDHSR